MTTVLEHITKEQLALLPNAIFLEPKSEHEQLRMKQDEVTLILYTSGKLVIQHKQDADISELLHQLGTSPKKVSTQSTLTKKKTPSQSFHDIPEFHVGSDEALKGDTFGGIVVAAFNLTKNNKQAVVELGVKDSKSLTDEAIMRIAHELETQHKTDSCVIGIPPHTYNNMVAQESLTILLNTMHQDVAKGFDDKHVVDKYPGCSIGDIQIEKGESHSIAIAAASILARATALKQIEQLSKKVGFKLPLGSTHVSEALRRCKKEGILLYDVAKVHFKNVQEYME